MMFHGVDLSGATVEDCGLTEERSYGHKDSGGPDLSKLLRTLPISVSDAVIDLGCGKGGALLTMAEYPFARVDGVELSPQLAQIAQQNVDRLHIKNSKLFCCDAASFTELDVYTYFYMYNPFPKVVMSAVISNITCSLQRHARNATLIYKNPVFHDVVVNAGFRKSADIREPHLHHGFSIYMWHPVVIPAMHASLLRA